MRSDASIEPLFLRMSMNSDFGSDNGNKAAKYSLQVLRSVSLHLLAVPNAFASPLRNIGKSWSVTSSPLLVCISIGIGNTSCKKNTDGQSYTTDETFFLFEN